MNETANDSNTDHNEADIQNTTFCQSHRDWIKKAGAQKTTVAWVRDSSDTAVNCQS